MTLKTDSTSDTRQKGVEVRRAVVHELGGKGGSVLEDHGEVYPFERSEVVGDRYGDLKLNMRVRIDFDLLRREVKSLEIVEDDSDDYERAPSPPLEDLLLGGFGKAPVKAKPDLPTRATVSENVIEVPEPPQEDLEIPMNGAVDGMEHLQTSPHLDAESTSSASSTSSSDTENDEASVEDVVDQREAEKRFQRRGRASAYQRVRDFLRPLKPEQTKLDIHCTVVNSEHGEVVVRFGRTLLKFDCLKVQSPFTPEIGDLLVVHLEVKDGKLKPMKFMAEEEAVWPEAKVLRIDRRTKGLLEFGIPKQDGVFSMSVIGVGGYPRVNDLVVAKMIRTSDRCPWRAIEVSHARVEQLYRRYGGAVRAMGLTDSHDRRRLNAWMENKNGIIIDENLRFGRVAPGEVSSPGEITVMNTSDDVRVIVGIDFVDDHSRKIFKLDPKTTKVVLQPGDKYELQVICDRSWPGIPTQNDLLIRFKFAGKFEIARVIHVDFVDADGDGEDVDDPFGNRVLTSGAIGKIFRAPRTKVPPRTFVSFDHYAVPDDLYARCERGGNLLEFFPFLAEFLSPDNYISRMKALIYLQNIGDAYELANYAMQGVRMAKVGEYLTIDVPNLSEGRPSILCYDEVIVSEARSFGGNEYKGRILEIRDNGKLCIKFIPGFHEKYNGQQLDLRFSAGIGAYMRTHHAVGVVKEQLMERVLFPDEAVRSPLALHVVDEGRDRPEKYEAQETPSSATWSVPMYTQDEEHQKRFIIRWFNPELNVRQRLAVRHIVAEESRIPYLIFGPPGTGKTSTVVESIMQIFHMRPEARLMVAVPSNSAGDLICTQLVEYLDRGWLRKESFIRYVASQREIAVVPESVRPHVVKEPTEFDEKVLADLSERLFFARIVIATWHMCGNLHLKGLSSNHFTHVIIDEAGHLTEPESLVPITLCPEVRVILAGDPKQLGPVIVSQAAKTYGLGKSLLERLMAEGRPYQRDLVRFAEFGGFDPSVVTQLIENYRSHPIILELYSELSYNGELVPRIPDEGVPDWVPEKLRKYYPLLVVGCNSGFVQRDAKCPSPYNLAEINRTCRYVNQLIEEGGLPADQIGVVTPYRKQVEKIRQELRNVGAHDVKVASVEEFQGSERKVIIITTVQTHTDQNNRQRSAMFWSNSFFASQRHTNVAISRARNFLIVIGDPKLMAKDRCWRRVLAAAFEDKDRHYVDVGGAFKNPFIDYEAEDENRPDAPIGRPPRPWATSNRWGGK